MTLLTLSAAIHREFKRFLLILGAFILDEHMFHLAAGSWVGSCSQLSCETHHPSSSDVIGLLLVHAHLLLVLMVSDDFTQHVNAASSGGDSCVLLVILSGVI